MASRTMQQSLRRFALAKPSQIATSRALVPFVQARTASIASSHSSSVPKDDSMEILVRQRLSRPVAPHLTVYKPQLTWILSGLNRITGTALSGSLYVFGLAYLASPLLGLNLSSAAIAAGFAKWPYIAQLFTKSLVSWPFWFHSYNGVRHLIWDTGRQITNMQVIYTGWTVIGLSVVSAVGLAVLL